MAGLHAATFTVGTLTHASLTMTQHASSSIASSWGQEQADDERWTEKRTAPAGQAPLPAGRGAEECNRLVAEANALALYVARHGDSLPGDDGKALYDRLLEAIANASTSGSASIGGP